MGWRRKLMGLSEWQPFQERFGTHLVMTGGDPDVAMFAESEAGSGVTAIYIHGSGLEALERSSPGGWQDSAAPAGENVVLLVGDARAFERLGIRR